MARRRRATKRKLMPDPVHNSEIVAKFINVIMQAGKKSTAESIVYGAFNEISKKSKGTDPLEIFYKALENVSPTVEVKARRVGGSTYQIPVEVRSHRKQSLAMRWLIESAISRSGSSMMERLAAELLDANENRGNAFKKKEDVHRMAQANKAFAHFNKEKERS
jgi:small subunit ribosomal protein S7